MAARAIRRLRALAGPGDCRRSPRCVDGGPGPRNWKGCRRFSNYRSSFPGPRCRRIAVSGCRRCCPGPSWWRTARPGPRSAGDDVHDVARRWDLPARPLSASSASASGTPLAGRRKVEFEKLIGLFMNTVVLRTRLDRQSVVRRRGRRASGKRASSAWDHDLPFEQLLQTVPHERSLSHSPFFQIYFQLRNFPRAGASEVLPVTELERGFRRGAGGPVPRGHRNPIRPALPAVIQHRPLYGAFRAGDVDPLRGAARRRGGQSGCADLPAAGHERDRAGDAHRPAITAAAAAHDGHRRADVRTAGGDARRSDRAAVSQSVDDLRRLESQGERAGSRLHRRRRRAGERRRVADAALAQLDRGHPRDRQRLAAPI